MNKFSAMDNDQFVTPPKRSWKFEHSVHVSERKRALFPSQDSDSDSDLGLMSPLENSSSPEKYESLLNVSKRDNNDKYFTFFDKFKKNNNRNEENCDPKNLSPIKDFSKNDIFVPNTPSSTNCPQKNHLLSSVPDTPSKSPSAILKTPHDNSSTNIQVPRLVRKSLLDISNIDKSSLKRKSDSPEESNNKSFKLDHSAQKPPKARTALFTENDSCVSAKSFYGSTDSSKHDVSFRSESNFKTKFINRKPNPVYLCSRGKNKKKNFGQINAGVRHGIRKPKRKPALSKTQLLKAALNIVKNSPLNDFLDNVAEAQNYSSSSENECGVSLEQIKKMDSILKNMESTTQAKPLTIFARHETPSPEPPKESFFGVKRSLSPEPDSKRKFFKSGPSKATISITDNITLKLDKGELSLIEKEIKIRKPRKQPIIDFDMSDLTFTEEKIIDDSFTDILKSLEDDKIVDVKNVILSPTSLMCDLTSGLALDSPKSQTTTSEVDLKKATFKKRISFPEIMDKDQKFFPIFYGKQSNPKPQEKRESRHVKNIRKIWKPLSDDQTLIDAGQKKFGVTQCSECKVMYSMGEPEDEIMHYNYHNSISVFRYHTWRNERVVNQFHNGKVIQVNPNDPKNWWKKVKEVLEVVNRELGFVDDALIAENKKIFLCIVNKQIVGCLVAEPKLQAHKIIPSSGGIDLCSEESYPIKCGVSRIWVAQNHRTKGIATCMMNAMRSHFMYGHILLTSEIAFSAPTDAGKRFAEKYTNTPKFLIYTS